MRSAATARPETSSCGAPGSPHIHRRWSRARRRAATSMNSVSAHPALIAKPPIRVWRIVAGAFLHFAVPVYVVTVAVATLFTAPAGAPLGELARLALGYSGW